MANKNPNTENLKKFVKGQAPANPAGRPKKMFTQLLDWCREQGVEPMTKNSFVEVNTMLLSLPLKKVRELSVDEEQPMIIRIQAKHIIEANGGAFQITDFLLNRSTVGKVSEETNHTGGIEIKITKAGKD